MVRWIVLSAMALAGCSQVLGLDHPVLVDAVSDLDGDKIADVFDNCPDVANADQADSDGDGIGDACDDCLALRLRSEDDDDRDGVRDLDDTCVGMPGSQADGDLDGIGDVCDPTSEADRMLCIFTFRDPDGSEPALLWQSTWQLGGWDVKTSQLVAAGSSTARDAIAKSAFQPGSRGIALETRGQAAIATSFSTGLVAISQNFDRYECLVVESGGVLKLQLQFGNMTSSMMLSSPISTSGVTRLAFEVAGSASHVTCQFTFTGSSNTTLISMPLSGPIPTLYPGVTATNTDVSVDDVVVYQLGV